MSLESSSNLEQAISDLRSEVTRLQEQVDMKVSAGGVISHVNIEAGKTLITSDGLHFNAETVVFSDDTSVNNKEEK